MCRFVDGHATYENVGDSNHFLLHYDGQLDSPKKYEFSPIACLASDFNCCMEALEG